VRAFYRGEPTDWLKGLLLSFAVEMGHARRRRNARTVAFCASRIELLAEVLVERGA
jgi:endonuclease YncB( thermonuclease family)